MRGYFNEPDFKIGSRHRDFTPGKIPYNPIVDGPADVDTSAIKQQFLAGDKEAVMYCDPKEPKTTSYASIHRGHQVSPEQKAEILDHNLKSFVG